MREPVRLVREPVTEVTGEIVISIGGASYGLGFRVPVPVETQSTFLLLVEQEMALLIAREVEKALRAMEEPAGVGER